MAEFEVDDLVRVGEAGDLGVVVLAAGRAPDPATVPGNLPDLNGLCCTPLALVRTIANGSIRWVRAVDMAAAEAGPGTESESEAEAEADWTEGRP
ncbi:hypothetical protein [Catenulispora rubra]|uniref:hypothetical protein n=1 Tax=Catenulispora rubra TaxID=280293 RepID=UPI0018923D8D|nr:hypothetical protein [Catenulispora rubra]